MNKKLNLKLKDKIYNSLIKSGTKHPTIWKGYAWGESNDHGYGWYYKPFSSSYVCFLGKNIAEVEEFLGEPVSVTGMRKQLHESGWEYAPGKGWALSSDIVDDSTGECQYLDLESAYDQICDELETEALGGPCRAGI